MAHRPDRQDPCRDGPSSVPGLHTPSLVIINLHFFVLQLPRSFFRQAYIPIITAFICPA